MIMSKGLIILDCFQCEAAKLKARYCDCVNTAESFPIQAPMGVDDEPALSGTKKKRNEEVTEGNV